MVIRMQEGQDRSGDQSPDYLGAWSSIPAGDQPDRPSDDEPAAAESQVDQDGSAAPEGTWIIPAAGDERSGTQGQDSAGQELGHQEHRPQAQDDPEQGLAGLGFGPSAAAGSPAPGGPASGSAAPDEPQAPPAPGQGGYGHAGGCGQPGTAPPG